MAGKTPNKNEIPNTESDPKETPNTESDPKETPNIDLSGDDHLHLCNLVSQGMTVPEALKKIGK